MATLTVKISSTGEKFELEDVDLNAITPADLISQLTQGGSIPALGTGEEYRIQKGGTIISQQNISLHELGFKDGDEVGITTKSTAA